MPSYREFENHKRKMIEALEDDLNHLRLEASEAMPDSDDHQMILAEIEELERRKQDFLNESFEDFKADYYYDRWKGDRA